MRRSFLFVCMLFVSIAGVQAQVELSGRRLESPKDSFRDPKDTFVTMHYFVKNVGSTTYNGSLQTHMRTSKGRFTLFDTTVSNFKANDSIRMPAPMYFAANAFNSGKDIIIIWPTGTGAKTVDSLQKEIEVIYFSRHINAAIGEYELLPAEISIYPNPSSGQLVIKCSDKQTRLQTARIYDIAGKEVLCVHQGMENLDISALGAGTYILQLQAADGGQANYKVVKR